MKKTPVVRLALLACLAVAGAVAAWLLRDQVGPTAPELSRLVPEEQFGPVMPLLQYDHFDDAIARANNTEYGLGATLWGRDEQRAYQAALRLESGTVWINKHLDLPADIAFGGAKQSGLGVALGQEGLEEFTQAKIINALRS